MKQIDKEYTQPFLVEATKLTSIVNKIHERLGDHAGTTTHDSYEVFMSGNRHEKLNSLEAVLALENLPKQKIQRLMVVSSSATIGASRPEHEVQVDFGKVKKTGDGSMRFVEISVRSDEPGWANRTLSAVEEQVERTLQRPPQFLVTMVLVLAASFVVGVFSQFATIRSEPRTDDILRAMWLSERDMQRLEQIVGQNRTITDEDLREIVTRQLRNVLEDEKPHPAPARKGGIRQAIFVLLPLGTLLVCAIVLVNSYPGNVFKWGDEIERHDAIVQRRKTTWNIVIGIVIIGIVGNLLSTKLISLIAQ